MENTMEPTIVYWGYRGTMENQMEPTIGYWGYRGIMENKMETTIVYWVFLVYYQAWTWPLACQT